jgi:hypothetical protein
MLTTFLTSSVALAYAGSVAPQGAILKRLSVNAIIRRAGIRCGRVSPKEIDYLTVSYRSQTTTSTVVTDIVIYYSGPGSNWYAFICTHH